MPKRSGLDVGSLLTTLTFSALAALACAIPVHNDTWWHLRAGQVTWSGLSPFVDHFSWTVAGQFFWNHSWLSQAIFYVVYKAGGLPLLTAVCATAAVTTWWLVWRECRGDAIERLLLLGVALPVSTVTWSVRPQVAIVLLPIVVKLVADGRIVAVSMLMALWANLHAGFAVAATVLAAGIGAALLFDRRSLIPRIAVAVAATGATLLTPLGVTNWKQIVLSMGRSKANAIVEWQPPGLEASQLFFWGTAAAFAVLLGARWRRLDSPYLQISALAACLALLSATQAIRNVPAFMLLALPPLSAMLFGGTKLAARVDWKLAAPAPAIAAAWLWTHPTSGMDWHPISLRARAAVAACQGPIFNTYGAGGPLIWFVPSQKVFVDSRQDPYPVALVQEAVVVEERGAYREAFERHRIRCAVLPPWTAAVPALAAEGWRTTYADHRWVVLDRTPITQPPE